MDVYAVESGTTAEKSKIVYDVEVQRDTEDALVRRARFYQGLITAYETPTGTKFKKLLQVYVIFITENDIFHAGFPIYDVVPYCLQTQKQVADNSHTIFFNGEYRVDEKDPKVNPSQRDITISKLMHDFSCHNSKDMYDQYLAGEMTAVKADEQEVGKMCQAMEEACLKAQKKQLDTLNEIRKMLHSGKSPDELLDMGYSQEDITYVIESEAESKEVAEAETLATVRYIAKLMKNGTSRKELLDMGYKPEFIDFAADMSN